MFRLFIVALALSTTVVCAGPATLTCPRGTHIECTSSETSTGRVITTCWCEKD